MPLFGQRVSMLEVQNRALIKAARERADRIEQLEHELPQSDHELARLKAENDRLKAEREFFSKTVLTLEEQNRKLTEAVAKHQKVERELTEAATKYSLWGQQLERELNRIDPDGAPRRRFGAKGEE